MAADDFAKMPEPGPNCGPACGANHYFNEAFDASRELISLAVLNNDQAALTAAGVYAQLAIATAIRGLYHQLSQLNTVM